MRKIKNVLWGIALLAFGVFFALDVLHVLNFTVFFAGWWTLFIIVPCAIGLITERDKTGNFTGIAFGVMLLLGCQKVISFNMMWKLIIPTIMAIVGLRLIFVGFIKSGRKRIDFSIGGNHKGLKTSTTIFSGDEIVVNGEVFEGAELIAIFGGIKCDLRNAIIEKDCVITVSAAFSGIDIFVPENVNVVIKATSIIGGTNNKTHPKAGVPTIYVSGISIFGGLEVK